jgi:hypothetical protein
VTIDLTSWRRLRRRAFDPGIRAWQLAIAGVTRVGHLLIVAGPSGSGKSTFLANLASGELPDDMKANIPPGAQGWIQTNGRRLVRQARTGRYRQTTTDMPGIVMHYDIMRPYEKGWFDDYPDDPALKLLSMADQVTVIVLKPSVQRLTAQLSQKEARRDDRAMSRRAQLLRLYQQPGWLDDWYRRWEGFVTSTVSGGKPLKIICLEPGVMPPVLNSESFRLTSVSKGGFTTRGSTVLCKRRIVAATSAWLDRCRRGVRDFDYLATTALAFLRLATTRLILRRLPRRSAGI